MKWSILAASTIFIATTSLANAEIYTCKGTPAGASERPAQTVTVVTPTDITPGGSFFYRRVTGIETELNTRRLLKEGGLEITKPNGRTERHALYQSIEIQRDGNLIGMAMNPRGHI